MEKDQHKIVNIINRLKISHLFCLIIDNINNFRPSNDTCHIYLKWHLYNFRCNYDLFANKDDDENNRQNRLDFKISNMKLH